jgi:hypothetical protein
MGRKERSSESPCHRDPLTGLCTHDIFLTLLSKILSRISSSTPAGILYSYLKIDRSFIHNIHQDKRRFKLFK